MTKHEELKRQVKELIRKNQTEKALELLAKEQLSTLDKDIIILNSRYSKVTEQQRLGVIGDDLAQRKLNRINLDLLDLSEKIGGKGVRKSSSSAALKDKKSFSKWFIIAPALLLIVAIGSYYFGTMGTTKKESTTFVNLEIDSLTTPKNNEESSKTALPSTQLIQPKPIIKEKEPSLNKRTLPPGVEKETNINGTIKVPKEENIPYDAIKYGVKYIISDGYKNLNLLSCGDPIGSTSNSLTYGVHTGTSTGLDAQWTILSASGKATNSPVKSGDIVYIKNHWTYDDKKEGYLDIVGNMEGSCSKYIHHVNTSRRQVTKWTIENYGSSSFITLNKTIQFRNEAGTRGYLGTCGSSECTSSGNVAGIYPNRDENNDKTTHWKISK